MAHGDIAVAIGVCRNTLEKYFETELSAGAMKRRMEMLDAMARTGLKGNVAAQKAYLAMTPTFTPLAVETHEPVGKKEQAKLDAVGAEAGTGWAGLLPDGVTPIRKAS